MALGIPGFIWTNDHCWTFQSTMAQKRKWLLIIPIGIVAAVIYMANFKMAADHMFYQPKKLLLVNAAENKVDSQRLVIGYCK